MGGKPEGHGPNGKKALIDCKRAPTILENTCLENAGEYEERQLETIHGDVREKPTAVGEGARMVVQSFE